MTKEAAIRQTATKATIKATFWKLRSIAKGSRSGFMPQIKVPNHEWMYHQPTNTLYWYKKDIGPYQVHDLYDKLVQN